MGTVAAQQWSFVALLPSAHRGGLVVAHDLAAAALVLVLLGRVSGTVTPKFRVLLDQRGRSVTVPLRVSFINYVDQCHQVYSVPALRDYDIVFRTHANSVFSGYTYDSQHWQGRARKSLYSEQWEPSAFAACELSRHIVWQQQRRVMNLLVISVIHTAMGCMTASTCSPFMRPGNLTPWQTPAMAACRPSRGPSGRHVAVCPAAGFATAAKPFCDHASMLRMRRCRLQLRRS